METDPVKMYFLLNMGIFHCYVSLPEGNYFFSILVLWHHHPASRFQAPHRPEEEQSKAKVEKGRLPLTAPPTERRPKDPKVLLDDSTPGTGFEKLGVGKVHVFFWWLDPCEKKS